MAKHSTIDFLPKTIKTELIAWLEDPCITQLQATDRVNNLLEELGIERRISKSAVNRYAAKMAEIGAKLRQSRELAKIYIELFGSSTQGDTGMMINGGLHAVAFELMQKVHEDDIDDPETRLCMIEQLKNLSLIMQRLEQSSAINIRREAEIRKQALEEAAKRAENAVDAVSQGSGGKLTPEEFKRILRDTYGA